MSEESARDIPMGAGIVAEARAAHLAAVEEARARWNQPVTMEQLIEWCKPRPPELMVVGRQPYDQITAAVQRNYFTFNQPADE